MAARQLQHRGGLAQRVQGVKLRVIAISIPQCTAIAYPYRAATTTATATATATAAATATATTTAAAAASSATARANNFRIASKVMRWSTYVILHHDVLIQPSTASPLMIRSSSEKRACHFNFYHPTHRRTTQSHVLAQQSRALASSNHAPMQPTSLFGRPGRSRSPSGCRVGFRRSTEAPGQPKHPHQGTVPPRRSTELDFFPDDSTYCTEVGSSRSFDSHLSVRTGQVPPTWRDLTTPSPPIKSCPIESPWVKTSGRPLIKFNGHENSHPLELRLRLSQTLWNQNS